MHSLFEAATELEEPAKFDRFTKSSEDRQGTGIYKLQKDDTNSPFEMHIYETVIERPDPDNPDKYVIVSQKRVK